MTIGGIAVAVALAACAKAYVPAGAKLLDVSGRYALAVSLFSTTCRGISVRNEDIIVDHAPGATALKLTYRNLPFDAKIRHDGNFSTSTAPLVIDGVRGTAWISGRFTDSAVHARVHGQGQGGSCQYQLRWSGSKL